MLDFSSAFAPSPLTWTIGGQTVTLPFLTAAEFASYGDEIRRQSYEKAKANPHFSTFNDTGKFRVKQGIDDTPYSVQDLIAMAKTAEGARFYVNASLIKGGLSKEEAAAAFNALDPFEQQHLSLAVTRINKLPTVAAKESDPAEAPLADGGPTTLEG